ncbi:WG repeat-containing protein [Moraxella bovis]|uniref:WG repeat-containing protein n=1 Tax=Moraxella bovis TaxID=476 RepID=UPI00222749F2|nr:WG repeat-containing protein [Moraxella bovis]UYZ69998.1 WG repeat-containing protein [Moraxella bovis]UYZ74088.1 WG repeat-containing protein [Moraxella bovis]UZA13289.1 WG repeat-containing protein [Moraxella bovis]UZA43972.1 WG repeat-containing protein [Moraxella bovis]
MIKKSLCIIIGLCMAMPAYSHCIYEKPLDEPITDFRCVGNLIERNHDYEYYSFIDKQGNVLFAKVDLLYDEYDRGIDMVMNGKTGLIDKDGRIKLPFKYERIGIFEKDDNLILVKSNGKFGYINQQGETVIDFIYDDAWGFGEGLAWVVQKRADDKGLDVYFIDEKGSRVFDVPKDVSSMGVVFNEGLYMVEKDGRFGYVNKEGELAIDYQDYDYVEGFEHGLNVVTKNDKEGAIDRMGNIVIPIKYDNIEYVDEHYFILTLGDDIFIANFKGDILKKDMRLYRSSDLYDDNNHPIYIATLTNEEGYPTALVNHELKEIVPFHRFDNIFVLNANYFEVKNKRLNQDEAMLIDDERYGIIDNQGRLIFEPDYQIDKTYYGKVMADYYILKNKHHAGVIDKNMNVLLPFDFDDIYSPDMPFFIVKKDDKVALYQYDKAMTGFDYQKIEFITPTLWAVQKDDKWALINEQNKPLTKFIYDDMDELKYGMIPVLRQGKWGVLDEHYQEIIAPVHDGLWILDNGAIGVSTLIDGYHKYGLVDKKGVALTQIEFDDLSSFGATTIRVAKQIGDKQYYGLLDTTGKEIFPVKYDFITQSDGATEEMYLNDETITINKAGKILTNR